MRVIPEEIYSQNTVAVGERACGKTTEKRMEKQSKSPPCQRIRKCFREEIYFTRRAFIL